MKMRQVRTWHVVSNEEGLILAVYGAALLSVAQEECRKIKAMTGLPAVLHSIVGDRPSVGMTISMRGAHHAV